jgi:ABC-2 type transport system ATP-binding protein
MTAALRVQGLVKQFRRVRALDGIDLQVEQGEFFGLLGPNGAGKTTLISVLAGLTRPTHGTAEVMGFDVARDYRQSRRALGVVPQELVYDPFFTARETLRLQSGYFGIRRNDDWIDHILHHLGLTEHADKNMRALSGGMKRRVLVAQALVHKPPVIVLDEPTAGVDVDLRQTLWTFIRSLNEEGHTVVLTTHYLEEAETLCKRIAMLKQGRLVALDSTRNLLSRRHEQQAQLKLDAIPPDALGLKHGAGGTWLFGFQAFSQLESMLAAIRMAGLQVQEMQLIEPDLEDVFTEIIRSS